MSDIASETKSPDQAKYSKLLRLIATKMRAEDGKVYPKIIISLDLEFEEIKELAEIIKSKEQGYEIFYLETESDDNVHGNVYDIRGELASDLEANIINFMIKWSNVTHAKASKNDEERISWIYEYVRYRRL